MRKKGRETKVEREREGEGEKGATKIQCQPSTPGYELLSSCMEAPDIRQEMDCTTPGYAVCVYVCVCVRACV